jgi:hypothetical protein
MAELDEVFGKLLGRAPTDEERQRLYRVKETLGLSDNDALWIVLLTWESYDGRLREYPEKVATETRRVMEEVRQTVASVAEGETRKAHRSLADAVSRAASELAAKRIETSRWQAWAAAVGALVMFGSLCLVVGYGMGRGSVPFWARAAESPLTRIASALLGAPAGWMLFALVLPLAVQGIRTGLSSARDDGAQRSERATGWAMVGLSALGALACLVMLLKVV